MESYIFSIANRPRDVIALFNTCAQIGVENSQITETHFRRAVAEYSRGRLRALADEWHTDYPDLNDFTVIFAKRPITFKIYQIRDDAIAELCLEIASRASNSDRGLHKLADQVVNQKMTPSDFKNRFFFEMYRIGLVGLKTGPEVSASWADDTGQAVTRRQIDSKTSVHVSKKYAYALGTNLREKG